MKYTKGQLGLVIPKLEQKNATQFGIKDIQNWRKNLPMANLKTCVAKTSQVIQDINYSSVSNSEKLKILITLRPVIGYICESIESAYRQSPSNKQGHSKIFNIILSLNLELFNANKLVLENILNTENEDIELIHGSVYLSLQQSCKLLFLSYSCYRQPPKCIWLEAHKLFSFAKKQKFNLKPVGKQFNSHSKFKTLTDLYKHILIFSLVNPLRFDSTDMRKLYYAAEAWGPLLNVYTATENNMALFKLDMAQDAPPHYSAFSQSDNSHAYYVRLDRVINRLEALITLQEEPDASNETFFSAHELTISNMTLKTLLHAWTHFGQRNNFRKKASGTRTIAIGLHAIHWFATEVQKEFDNLQTDDQNDFEENVEEIVLDTFPLPQDFSEQPVSKPTTIESQVVDKSRGGYCLKLETKKAKQLKAGELLGVLHEDLNKSLSWQIAVLRWLQETDDDYTMLGVEILSLWALPVESYVTKTNPPVHTHCLFASQFLNHGLPYMLVAPKNVYKKDNNLVMCTEQERYDLKLCQDLDISAMYGFWEIKFDGENYQDIIPKEMFIEEPKNLNH